MNSQAQPGKTCLKTQLNAIKGPELTNTTAHNSKQKDSAKAEYTWI